MLHGTHGNRLADDQVTLAEVLRDAGYATAAFISAFPAGSHFGLAQGFETFDEEFEEPPGDETVTPAGLVDTGLAQRRSDATTDRALSWLAGASGPVFVWVHYFDPHDPYLEPPPSFLERFPKPSGSEEERLRQLYDIEVSYMDRELGRLVDGVRDSLGLDRTLVIVTADHGQGLGDHEWWSHGILYQEQIRVPLIVRLPRPAPGAGAGGSSARPVAAGRRVTTEVRSIDLVPTVLDVAGIPPESWPASLDGESLRPLLEGAGDERDRPAYADSINRVTYNTSPAFQDVKDDFLFALIRPPWKYIHHLLRPDESELYDLASDPGETKNLLREKPDLVRRFGIELRQRQVLPRRRPTQEDPEARKRLESLGYVQ